MVRSRWLWTGCGGARRTADARGEIRGITLLNGVAEGGCAGAAMASETSSPSTDPAECAVPAALDRDASASASVPPSASSVGPSLRSRSPTS